jgi:hypothetical protein
MRGKESGNPGTQGMSDQYDAFERQHIEKFLQICSVSNHMIPRPWLAAVSTTSQVIGNNAIFGRQLLAKTVEKPAIGRQSMDAYNGYPLSDPVYIMNINTIYRNIVLLHGHPSNGYFA